MGMLLRAQESLSQQEYIFEISVDILWCLRDTYNFIWPLLFANPAEICKSFGCCAEQNAASDCWLATCAWRTMASDDGLYERTSLDWIHTVLLQCMVDDQSTQFMEIRYPHCFVEQFAFPTNNRAFERIWDRWFSIAIWIISRTWTAATTLGWL